MVEILPGGPEGLAVALALGLAPALVAFYLNERAKRRDFARQEKYDRMRAAFEAAVAALHRRRAVSRFVAAMAGGDGTPKGPLAELLAPYDHLMQLGEFAVAGRDDRLLGKIAEGVRAGTSAGAIAEELAVDAVVLAGRLNLEAREQFERATTTLRLLDGDTPLAAELEGLFAQASEATDDDAHRKAGEAIRALELRMHHQLEALIAGRGRGGPLSTPRAW